MLARYLSSMYTVDHDLQTYQITNSGLLRSGLLKRLESSPQALHSSLEDDRLTRGVPGSASERIRAEGEALSEWVSSDSDDLNEFVADFDDDEKIESVDGYHLSELKADVESDIALLYRLRDLAEVVVHNNEPKVRKIVAELTDIAAQARRVDPREYRALIVER